MCNITKQHKTVWNTTERRRREEGCLEYHILRRDRHKDSEREKIITREGKHPDPAAIGAIRRHDVVWGGVCS
jgi:hypothetical protein